MSSSIALVTCFRATATVPMARASQMLNLPNQKNRKNALAEAATIGAALCDLPSPNHRHRNVAERAPFDGVP